MAFTSRRPLHRSVRSTLINDLNRRFDRGIDADQAVGMVWRSASLRWRAGIEQQRPFALHLKRQMTVTKDYDVAAPRQFLLHRFLSGQPSKSVPMHHYGGESAELKRSAHRKPPAETRVIVVPANTAKLAKGRNHVESRNT